MAQKPQWGGGRRAPGNSGFDEKKASLSTWIYKITQNAVIDYYRKAKSVYGLPEELCFEGNIDEEMLNEETLKSLADALEQLPQRESDIIILHYYSGKTLKSIAEIMDISYSYVKLLHTKALNNLREIINE
ncbi:MAG: sigma-70 family RNA polymerase sigma factor [Lachnospiraceae bacterium]|nr:sigma-70 family RNA polymerase sigma factor [Lachnospiraceae bacterium]